MYLYLCLYKDRYWGNSHSSISAQCITLTVRLSCAGLSSRWQSFLLLRGLQQWVLKPLAEKPQWFVGLNNRRIPAVFHDSLLQLKRWWRRPIDVLVTSHKRSTQTADLLHDRLRRECLWVLTIKTHKKIVLQQLVYYSQQQNPKSNVPRAGAGGTGEDRWGRARLLPQTKQHIHPSHWRIYSASLSFCSGLWYLQNDPCWLVRTSTSTFPGFHSKLNHLVNRREVICKMIVSNKPSAKSVSEHFLKSQQQNKCWKDFKSRHYRHEVHFHSWQLFKNSFSKLCFHYIL